MIDERDALNSSVPDAFHPGQLSNPNNAVVYNSRSRSCSPSNFWWRKNCSPETKKQQKVGNTLGIAHIVCRWNVRNKMNI